MKKYNVGIIGLGNIGMLYDYYDYTENLYLSHAKSFYDHPLFDLQFLIDIDTQKLELAKKRFGAGVNYLKSVDQINILPEILVLSSLSEVNLNIFKLLKDNQNIKLFLIEKPFWTASISDEQFLPYSSKCFINYFRKYLPFFQNLRKEIKSNAFGLPISCHIWYSKGLRNNGSHLIDLCNYLFDSSFNLDSTRITDVLNDYRDNDPTVSFSIKYNIEGKGFPVLFQAADERLFSLIEVDLLFEKSRFKITDFGGKIEISKVEKDPVFPGYKNLIIDRIEDSDINKYGKYMCNYLYELLSGHQKNISSLNDEKNIYSVINNIQNKLKNHE